MNFIFFMPDEMRAESVSCYGHPLVRMPNFDQLAREGVRFEQCHVQHPVCSPERCSLMTGWSPHVAGHRTLWHLLRSHEPSLFRYLREAGYYVEWHGKNDLYSADSFPGCVDTYDHSAGGHAGSNPFSRDDPRYFSFLYEPFPGAPEETGDAQDLERGLELLRRWQPGDKPFMLYLPLLLPHAPYAAPEPFHSMYSPADVPPLRPSGLPGKPDFHELIRRYRRLDQMSPDFFRQIQAVYLGMNSYSDWLLGRLLDVLEETGRDKDTTLFVFSDHGDWAGDYGLVEKWPSALDDTITRVPLLVRAPGCQAGHVAREQVELFDVMATTLELAGVEARHTHFARSLILQLRGEPGDASRAVYAEGGYNTHEPQCFEGRWTAYDIPRSPDHIYYPKGLQQQEHPESVCRTAMIRTLTHKLVRRTHGVCELYDLTADPRELNNVYGEIEYAVVRAKLETRLLDWYIHTADVTPINEDARGLPARSGAAPPDPIGG